jgi:hypothetical protein
MALSLIGKLTIKNVGRSRRWRSFNTCSIIGETDNKNLTSLNRATSSRVYRWKLAIQRYAFNIRHVVGELNVVADAFLRCVFDNHSTKAYPIQAVATMSEIVLTDEQYNTIGQFHNSIYCWTCGDRPDSKANAQSRDFVALLT